MSKARDLADLISTGATTMAAQESGAVSVTGGSVTGIDDISVADGGTGSSTARGAQKSLGIRKFNQWIGA